MALSGNNAETGRSPIDEIRWLPFRNTSAFEIPAHGVFRISGTEQVGNMTILLGDAVSDNPMDIYAVNYHIPVSPQSEFGRCTLESPVPVKIAGSDPFASGVMFGFKQNSFLAEQYYHGFVTVNEIDPTNDIWLCFRDLSVPFYVGETTTEHPKDSVADIAITTPGGPDTFRVPSRNNFADVQQDKTVHTVFVRAAGEFQLTAAECDTEE